MLEFMSIKSLVRGPVLSHNDDDDDKLIKFLMKLFLLQNLLPLLNGIEENMSQTKLDQANSFLMVIIGWRKTEDKKKAQIEYFGVCTSGFHFGADSILKESETNITDNWSGREVREQRTVF